MTRDVALAANGAAPVAGSVPADGGPDDSRLSVAIVAGNEVVRWGLDAVLRSMPAVDTIRRCASPDQVTALLQSEAVDFVIVAAADAAWPEGIRRPLADAGTTILVLVDESSLSDPGGYASLPVGGFLWQQNLSAQTLSDVFRRCRLGELPIPPMLARALLARVEDPAGRPPARPPGNLTRRELEALSLLVRGLSNKQIARRLSISSHGAKRLVSSIMLKLGSPNRTSAAVLAIRTGIVHNQ